MLYRILKLIFGVFASFLFLMTLTAHATAIFLITTSTPTVTLPPGGSTTVTYQVKNQSNISFSAGQVKVKAPQFTTIASNTCSSAVAKGATCTVVLTVTAPNQTGTLTLILQVCALHVCSVPDSANRLTVIISNVSSLAITPTSATISSGSTQQFTAIVTFANGSTENVTTQASWNSSNTSVATINSSGLATGVSGGTTNITATFQGITSNTAVLTVTSNAYIANFAVSTVSLCGVDNSGNLTGCVDSGATLLANPLSIAANTANNQVYAYMANFNFAATPGIPAVTKCTVNASNGTLGSCVDAGIAGLPHNGEARTVAFNLAGPAGPAGTKAYVADNEQGFGSQIWFCSVEADGSFTGCAITSATHSGLVTGISFDPTGSFAYLSVNNQNIVRICTVQSGGNLSGCADTGVTDPWSPVAFTNSGTRAYVTSFGPNQVILCNVGGGGGSISGCANLSIGAVFSTPEGIIFNNTETQAYVVNNGDSTVSLCSVNTGTGQFNSCADSGATGLTGPSAMILH